MSNKYETRYGVTFNGNHSFRKYRLLPTSAPVISPPEVKTFYVDVPGADGSLDLTEVLTGYVTYGDRDGDFNFQIYAPKEEWYDVYNDVVHDLNGKQADVILDEDAQYYYKGRLTVGKPSFGKNTAKLKISGVFSANKYVQDTYSGNDWLWDPFDFNTGIAREYYQINVRNSKTITLIGSELIVCPIFTLNSGNLTAVVNGNRYVLESGENIFLDILLTESNLDITFVGNGVVTVNYRIGGTDT